MTASTDSPVAARGAPRQRVPDFFIVGHAKSGTTALYNMLRQHPQIFMPDVKEPSYFVPELRRYKRRSAKHPDTLEEYLSLFGAATPEQAVGEATPSYLWSQTAASRIAELQPSARVIAVLREPASFLRSLHMQFVQTNVETENDLRKAIELEPQRLQGKAIPANSTRPKALLYSEHVRYVEQLRRYRAVFAAEQVLVLIYEDFKADNETTVRQVLRFLEVDEEAAIDVAEVNPSVRVRFPRVYKSVRAIAMGRGPVARRARAVIKALTPQRLRHDVIAVERRAQWSSPPQPDEELMRELRSRYKSEVVALSEYLDRDLVTFWGYDRID